MLVLLYLGDVLLGYRHIVLEVEVVEYGAEWEGLHLLEEGETLEALAFVLVLAQCGKRLRGALEVKLRPLLLPCTQVALAPAVILGLVTSLILMSLVPQLLQTRSQ